MNRRSRRAAAVLAGTLFALILGAAVLAQTGNPRDKIRTGGDIVIGAGETVDHDLYAFGQTVTVDGTIHGDLVAAATQILINGTIDGDVFAAASTVSISGIVHGDVRVGASDVTISGTVDEDVAVLSAGLLLAINGRIGQDLIFATSETTLEGNVAGGIDGSATDYVRRGTVGGSESVSLAVPPGQAAGDRTLNQALDAMRQLAAVILFGVIGLWLLPRGMRTAAGLIRARPVQSIGVGFLGLLGYVVAIVTLVLFLILAGIVLGRLDFGALFGFSVFGAILAGFVLTFLLFVVGAFLADALVGLALGRLITTPEGSRWAELLRLIVGAAIVVVLTSFPVVGSWVKFFVILAGLGAVTLALVDWRRARAVAASPGAAPGLMPPGAPV